MLKIRLARTGKRGQATYRIVVMEARTSRQGSVVDTLGWYNPGLKADGLSLDMEKYAEWVKKGAQASDSVLRLTLTKEEKEKRWPSIAKKEAPAKEE
ncbi:30S ribosomal protein S16 [bacterium]|nr:30S ribosomal protein S16 [bacterium]